MLDLAWAALVEGFPWASSREKLIEAIEDVMDEPPVHTIETFGQSAGEKRRAAAMYELAGGPAPIVKRPPQEPPPPE